MSELIKEIREIEYTKIDYHKETEDYFEFKKGEIPILISAPHGTRHFRKDKWIGEDEYTSSIAIKLAEVTGSHVIYVKSKIYEDSNYLKRTRYKDEIKKVVGDYGIKFLADIHGADKDRAFKICVGTRYDNLKECSCPTFKDIIEDVLKNFQKSQIFNHLGFKARGKGTVSSFARLVCGIESAQFEINAKYRIIDRRPDSSKAIEGIDPDFKAKEGDVLELFNHLKEMILRMNAKIGQDSHI